MKVYRILYWFGSIITEKFMRAENEEAIKKKIGDKQIIKIEEWE